MQHGETYVTRGDVCESAQVLPLAHLSRDTELFSGVAGARNHGTRKKNKALHLLLRGLSEPYKQANNKKPSERGNSRCW